jgi:hypothetical protein
MREKDEFRVKNSRVMWMRVVVGWSRAEFWYMLPLNSKNKTKNKTAELIQICTFVMCKKRSSRVFFQSGAKSVFYAFVNVTATKTNEDA